MTHSGLSCFKSVHAMRDAERWPIMGGERGEGGGGGGGGGGNCWGCAQRWPKSEGVG